MTPVWERVVRSTFVNFYQFFVVCPFSFEFEAGMWDFMLLVHD